ncbi:MAG: ZIP family metal transporter [Chloroflexota bacterium]|nr:ZIP family metal transporter [Chloroflexota bacterium]
MNAILLSFASFIATAVGGLFALRFRERRNLILGLTAGVLLGLVAFDLLPEIFREVVTQAQDSTWAMLALVLGFLLFHIGEKLLVIHHAHEEQYATHHHPQVGILSALALATHSFMDGVGIGLGFQASPAIGITVALAVIGHDFADGLNTVTLMLVNRNAPRRALLLLGLDAVAPVLGAISTLFFRLPDNVLPLYLGFFAGFLLYIGASDILPEAHREGSNVPTILLTITGTVFVFILTRFL